MTRKPKIIVYDIETSPIVTTSWGIYTQFIGHNSILKDWFIISAAWKTLGEKTVHSVQIDKPYDDFRVVKKIRDVLADADCIIGQNLDKFDMRKLNARMIFHGIAPLPPIPTIDTKKEAKKIAAFTSNKLDYLGKFLLGAGKQHVDFELWLRILNGDKKALKEMVEYNKIDVVRNEEVYEKLKPYMKNHPHIGVIAGNSKFHSCPNCGGTHLKRNGTRSTRAGVLKQELQCLDCGSFQRVPVNS